MADDDEEVSLVQFGHYQDQLREYGYTVIPVLEKSHVQIILENINDEAQSWPEFAERDKSAGPLTLTECYKDGPKYVCGGFGALGNPGSFHSQSIRWLRQYLDHKLRMEFWKPYQHRFFPDLPLRFSQTIDRFMCRAIGDSPSQEKWHRDEAKGGREGDHIFGGWVNLNSTNQTFSCIPKTHMPGVNPEGGFAPIVLNEQLRARYKATKAQVIIPCGHILIFYENIVHEVVGKTHPDTQVRLFTGWRFSYDRDPLNMTRAQLRKLLDDQAVIPLKSGQMPPMWPKLYMCNFVDKLNEWTKIMFGIPNYKNMGKYMVVNPKTKNVTPVMKSYEEMGMPKFPEYFDDEVEIYFPKRIN